MVNSANNEKKADEEDGSTKPEDYDDKSKATDNMAHQTEDATSKDEEKTIEEAAASKPEDLKDQLKTNKALLEMDATSDNDKWVLEAPISEQVVKKDQSKPNARSQSTPPTCHRCSNISLQYKAGTIYDDQDHLRLEE